jgi:AcrR family transcriptional regulator
MPKGIPLTEQELNRRRHEIFGASVKLFLKNGFPETSLREIAQAARIGKSTLYDYFPSKDEILLWGMEDEIADLAAAAGEIAGRPLPAIERLRQAMRKHVEILEASKEFYVRLGFEVQRLSLAAQKRIQVRRHAYQDLIAGLIEDGMRDGSFRAVDAFHENMLIIAVTPPFVAPRRNRCWTTYVSSERYTSRH